MTKEEKIARWMHKHDIHDFEIHGEAWFADGILVAFDGWRDTETYIFKFDRNNNINKVLGDDYCDRMIAREYEKEYARD